MLIQTILGNVTFSKEVISKIIGRTTIATKGITGMSTGIVEGIAQRLTGNSLLGGIELKNAENGLDIHLNIVVDYGIQIHEVCREFQRSLKESVEQFTGLSIGAIHIQVDAVSLTAK
ncbi:Asp23/Gls24 family envelope stress response protein [Paenibacillus sp. 276b]|uniref:Asp23/Gls24 family envelope stress response protein n=1 Tax=Paenibacillus sp. 276b TaxID=1566277 RepID=UPI0008992843|nr:Asp23/Gls24 family envelope stress response protein [Paenibacillus sp. 276b]SEA60558.1 Uncharacterized conserved protein YloU, alkaline shock protein (Asp23) family [Paenibacillus sp. 276b]